MSVVDRITGTKIRGREIRKLAAEKVRTKRKRRGGNGVGETRQFKGGRWPVYGGGERKVKRKRKGMAALLNEGDLSFVPPARAFLPRRTIFQKI